MSNPKHDAKKSALNMLMSHAKGLNINRSDKLNPNRVDPKAAGDLVEQAPKTQPEHTELISSKEASNLGEYGELAGLVGAEPKQASDMSLPANDPEKQNLPPEEKAPSEHMHKLHEHMKNKRGK